jgi:hypothetical protein
MQKCELNFIWKTCGDAIHIVLASMASFRFEEKAGVKGEQGI